MRVESVARSFDGEREHSSERDLLSAEPGARVSGRGDVGGGSIVTDLADESRSAGRNGKGYMGELSSV